MVADGNAVVILIVMDFRGFLDASILVQGRVANFADYRQISGQELMDSSSGKTRWTVQSQVV
jgi:hypothetical protein